MKTTKTLLAVAGLAGLLAFGSVARAEEMAAPPRFAEVITSNFSDWDSDRNGELSASEIDRLVVNPTVQGPDAAAAAALKRIIRSEKYELPSLTKDFLTRPAPSRRSRPAPQNVDRDDSTEKVLGPNPADPDKSHAQDIPTTVRSTSAAPDFQSRYSQCLTRIDKTDRTLFKSAAELTVAHAHQGPLGDCFLVAPIGALVKHDPTAIRDMISPLGNPVGAEGYDVKFGNGRTIRVSPITDAEIAISSTTGDGSGQDGLWLAVLEKAFGTMRRDDNPNRYEMESATDAIAKGGSTGSTISILTGHATERITLRRAMKGWTPETYDRNRRRVAPPTGTIVPMEPAGNLDALTKRIRDSVGRALSEGRLVAAGTGDERVPPGMSPKHAYAVVSFDEAADTLTLWNPHGNSHKPKGEPGRAKGWPTKAGTFEISVPDFVRVFNGVTLETGRPVGRRS
jgi:hypothetical protein